MAQPTAASLTSVSDRSLLPKAVAKIAPISVEEWTNPAASAATAIKTAAASIVAPTTYLAASLDGAIGAGAISPPRNILITTAGVTPADAPATATITGLDVDGNALSEVINVAQTGTTAAGVKCFASVSSIALSAADGTAATLAFGTGVTIGLANSIESRSGGAATVRELMDGVKAATEAVTTTPAVSPPHGSYTPNTAPNGAHDYALYYERA